MKNVIHSTAGVFIAAISVVLAATVGVADEHGQTTNAPGFRPESEHAMAFVDAFESSRIAVLPSLVRRESRTAHSFASQRLAVSLLNEGDRYDAVPANRRIQLGGLQPVSQWDLFRYGLDKVTTALATYETNADYVLVLEFLVPDSQNVFGIECYIVDRDGHSVFSFLLNSHHEIFARAKLRASNASEEAREAMLLDATRVAIAALEQQVDQARTKGNVEPATDDPMPVAKAAPDRRRVAIIIRLHERLKDVFMHSFKHSLVSGFASNGIESTVFLTARDDGGEKPSDKTIDGFAPSSIMIVELDPLLRIRNDGYEAIVGTVFSATMTDRVTSDVQWQISDKVDYVRMFGPRYRAHAGMRREFAWHTTESIVSQFMNGLYGVDSARIYTVTEDRKRHGQRID